MRILAFVGGIVALACVAVSAASQLVKNSPTATGTLTIGDRTYTFKGGGCLVSADSWSIALGSMADGQHVEMTIPSPLRATAPDAVRPTKDGSYTNVSLTVIPGRGENFHAGGRSRRDEGELTVILKNNRRAGELSGRTDSPRQPITGTFSC